MENTIENKKRFFALYWGQPVGKCLLWDDQTTGGLLLDHVFILGIMNFDDWVLELKPLPSIDNKDAAFLNIHVDSRNKDIYNELDINQIDYLRSRGYALPFMGVSVETLVEWGWIKLKK